MNIVFLTSEAAHHCYLINEINKCFPVKMVFFQTNQAVGNTWSNRFKKWRKIENVMATLKGLMNRLLFSKEERLEERYEKEKFFNGSEPFLSHSIPSKKVFSFNDTETVEGVRNENPDLIIVFGTDILKGEILNTAKLDILNIHRGIAPQYCGGSVVSWAFYRNDFENLGVTIHKCTDRLDSGDIVGQKHYKLQNDDSIYTLRYKTTIVALEILKKVIDRYVKGAVEYRSQGPTTVWASRDMTITKKIIARNNLRKYIKKVF